MNSLSSAFIDPVVALLPKIPGALISIVIGYLLIRIIKFFLNRFLKIVRFPRSIKSLINSAVNVVMWVILIIYIMNYLGLGSLIVALTGSAILIGFILNNGLAQTVSDIFSGISLAGDKDFKIGHKVSLNEGKIIGTVVSISMKKVKLVDDDNKLHIIPNSLFDKGEWIILEERKSSESDKSKK